MKKLLLALSCLVILNGCCWNGPNIGTPSFDRTIEKSNILTSAVNKINPTLQSIQVGMTREQVFKLWGKPTGNFQESDWFYTNYKEAGVQHPVTYEIHFVDDKVLQITESIWSEKAWMCKTADL